MTDTEQLEYGEIMPRVGELVDELMSHSDPEVRERLEEMLDWVDVFHREGLARFVEMIKSWRGELFLDESVAKDEVAGAFLEAYDLSPASEATV